MANKTSIELACEKIMEQDATIVELNKKLGYITPANCPDDKRCGIEQNMKDCSKCWQKYFDEHAGISNGWNVIKEIKDFCSEVISERPWDDYEDGRIDGYKDIVEFIDKKMQEYNIN